MTAARFWDRWAERYAAREISDPQAYEEKLRRTQAHLRPDMVVLELGCGTGGTARRHAPIVARYLATDASPEMIRIARGRMTDDSPSGLSFAVETVEEAIADAGRKTDAPDAILALSLLHLLPDWRESLAGIARSLKPGGLFVSNTFCFRDSHPWLRWVSRPFQAAGLLPRFAHLREAELIAAIEAAGFHVLETWRPDRKAALFVIARAR
ncbi:MAG: methyltransferase domain-containing protein [Marivibrio sp.]|uniref:class I SAM-dependent methyltransferase n=1 Tax=Marivibrio sp. TaxID=2039719 RepID=UPI0032F04E7E